ncbi:DUF7144 family membrane protein [Actinocorallia longicatena]|uniref:DUF7144 domain-containing protein n=1 Tax=Actinocorallia longicatena TaxID=111803 RepID=A0ABP6Q5Q1_9ACTN
MGRAVGRQTSGWASGVALFAGVMMIVIGFFEATVGLVAIIENEFYVLTTDYLFEFDVTTWGWIHLAAGILVGVSGFAVFAGVLWGRVIGIITAVLSGVVNFLYLPYYPVWAVLIIALDVLVIWALCQYDRKAAQGLGVI